MGTVTERDRMMLRQWAQEHMGEQNAEALMNCLPPKGWGDVATKSAVEGVRTEVAALRADVEKDLKGMGQGLSDRFTAQLATEIGKVHEKIGEVHKVIDEVRGERRAQTVTLIVMIFVSMFGQTALARFFPPPSPPPAQIVIQSPAG